MLGTLPRLIYSRYQLWSNSLSTTRTVDLCHARMHFASYASYASTLFGLYGPSR